MAANIQWCKEAHDNYAKLCADLLAFQNKLSEQALTYQEKYDKRMHKLEADSYKFN